MRQARQAREPERAPARHLRLSCRRRTAALAGVKYVITLDTDTQLPRDAAREFVAVMAHPLNRARFDATRNHGDLVTAGYGILQPRVSVSLPGANRSWYARLNSGEPGIDPYTRAVSDVYQDVCGEGSFIGKGIYDVDAFERALAGRFPDNRVLSHDLLEGCYARSGLVSDVQLYSIRRATSGHAAAPSPDPRHWRSRVGCAPRAAARRRQSNPLGPGRLEALRQPAARPFPRRSRASLLGWSVLPIRGYGRWW